VGYKNEKIDGDIHSKVIHGCLGVTGNKHNFCYM